MARKVDVLAEQMHVNMCLSDKERDLLLDTTDDEDGTPPLTMPNKGKQVVVWAAEKPKFKPKNVITPPASTKTPIQNRLSSKNVPTNLISRTPAVPQPTGRPTRPRRNPRIEPYPTARPCPPPLYPTARPCPPPISCLVCHTSYNLAVLCHPTSSHSKTQVHRSDGQHAM